MTTIKFIKLTASIAICLTAGFVGSIFTTPAIDSWYATINKPSFNPPNWIFAPVWTTLFILMGISLYLIMQQSSAGKNIKKSLYLFFGQLLLNIIWSVIFFGFKNPALALIEIIILLAVIILTTKEFKKINPLASWLFWPYICWVGFALILNFSIWFLNKS